jgi:type I restriction enzyme, S subunit
MNFPRGRNLPSGWVVKRLDFIARVKARLGWKGLTASEYVDDGYVFLSTPNIKGRDIDFTNVNYITEQRYLESPEIILKVGDVLLAKDGSTLGTCAVVRTLPRPATVNGSIAVIRPRPDIDPVFLFWALSSPAMQAVMAQFKDGMGVPHLFQSDLRKFAVSVPPFDEQRAIADFLDRETGKLDELVRAKESLILAIDDRRVSSIAEQVFGKQIGGLKDSGNRYLPSVPEHWDVVAFRRCVTISEGQVDPEDPAYKDVVLIAPNHIESGTGRILNTETADEQAAISGKYRVRVGDLIYSKIRPALNKVCLAMSDCLCSADMYALTPKDGMSVEYLLYLMLSRPFVQLVTDESMRVAMPKVNRPTLFSIRIPRPPLSEQEQIAARLRDELGRLATLSQKTKLSVEKLREYRSALISAAVTGQIDVRTHRPQEAAALCQ